MSFLLLAPNIAVQVHDLIGGAIPTAPGLGMAVTGDNLVMMPLLGVAKRHSGARLGSGATSGEGTQNLLCAAQAVAVLIGLIVTATLGWNWADPAIALLLAGWAVREGVEAWHGNDCC